MGVGRTLVNSADESTVGVTQKRVGGSEITTRIIGISVQIRKVGIERTDVVITQLTIRSTYLEIAPIVIDASVLPPCLLRHTPCAAHRGEETPAFAFGEFPTAIIPAGKIDDVASAVVIACAEDTARSSLCVGLLLNCIVFAGGNQVNIWIFNRVLRIVERVVHTFVELETYGSRHMVSGECVVITYECLPRDIIRFGAGALHPCIGLVIRHLVGFVYRVVRVFFPFLFQIVDILPVVVIREHCPCRQALQRYLPVQCEIGLERCVAFVILTRIVYGVRSGVVCTVIAGDIVDILLVIIGIRAIDRQHSYHRHFAGSVVVVSGQTGIDGIVYLTGDPGTELEMVGDIHIHIGLQVGAVKTVILKHRLLSHVAQRGIVCHLLRAAR